MSIGKFVRQEIIDLISASWSPYWGGGGGPGGDGTPGAPVNSIQFNYNGAFSGSNNFTFITSSNSVYLTGSLYISGATRQTGSIFLSGAISASFGANTVGFVGTASWAQSASVARSASYAATASYIRLIEGPNIDITYTNAGIEISASAGASTNIIGIDEYMSRFSGSDGLETSSFVNKRDLGSFHHATLNNGPATGSFIVGSSNTHDASYFGNSLGSWTQIVTNSSSLAANLGTSVETNYSVAINKYAGAAKKIRFRGYVSGGTIEDENSVSYAAAFVDPDTAYADIFDPTSLNSGLSRLVVYNENTGKIAIIKAADLYISGYITSNYSGTGGSSYRGFGIGLVNTVNDIYGTPFTDSAGTNSFLIFILNGNDSSAEANFASGLATNAFGKNNVSLGTRTAAIEYSNISAGVDSITKNSGSISSGYKLGTDAKFSNNFGVLNSVGRVYECQNLVRTGSIEPNTLNVYDVNRFTGFENGNTDIYDYLVNISPPHDQLIGRTDYSVIVVIPSIEYCGIIGLLALDGFVSTRYDILPAGVTNISSKDIRIIVPFDSSWDTRTPDLYPYAASAFGINNISAGSGSFVGGKNSRAKGSTAFAFGNGAGAINDQTITFGTNVTNALGNSFAVGFNEVNLFVTQSFVGVNLTSYPTAGFDGLGVSSDLWVVRDTTIGRNLIVSGNSYLGNELSDFTIVTGSLIVSNSLNVIGISRVTGSNIISGSWQLIGTGNITGSLTVSSSLNVIGVSNVTGSNNITGSWKLIGIGNVTGSLIVSNSLNVIGTSLVTGSNIISSSWNLIGIGNVTGSLIVSNSFTVIGTNTTTGSLISTGSFTLVGPQIISGSIFFASESVRRFISGADFIQFNTIDQNITRSAQIGWDTGNGTLSLGLSGSAGAVPILNIGQQQIARVYNDNGSPITKGQIVYISGAQGNRIAVKLASATAELGSANTIGVVLESMAAGAEGYITTEGPLYKLNTNGLTAGALLYLDTTPGAYTQTAPTAPNHRVVIGFVERVDDTVGSIYIKVDNGYEINELHNVLITQPTSSGDLFVWSGSVWTNSRHLSGSYSLTGSLIVTGSITASLGSNTIGFVGTSSWASQSVSASVAATTYATIGNLSQSYGISPFVFNGSTNTTVEVSGAGSLVNNRIIKWDGSAFVTSSAVDTGTLFLIQNNLSVSGTFQVSSSNVNQTQPAIQVNSDGLFILGVYTATPTAVEGALMYSGSEYYLGFNN